MVTSLLVLAISLAVLIYSSDFLVNSSVRIARFFKVSTALIGLTIVAFGTSAPELFLSAMAALGDKGNLSVGNVIGSNIFNLWFILGLAAMVSPILIRRKILKRDFTLLMILTVLMLVMLRNNEVDRRMGISLLLILVGYTAFLWIKKDVPEGEIEEAKEDLKETKEEDHQWRNLIIVFVLLSVFAGFTAGGTEEGFGIEWAYSPFMMWALIGTAILAAGYFVYSKILYPEKKHRGLFLSFLLLFVSLCTLIISSDHVVEAAVYLAQLRGMSEWAIGATIIAMGTSLPELAVTITSLLKKDYGLSVGNLIGSDIFNFLGIVGISATITPVHLEPTRLFGENRGFFAPLGNDIHFSLFLLCLTLILTAIFMRSGRKLSRVEGMILFGIALLRMVFEFNPQFFVGLFA